MDMPGYIQHLYFANLICEELEIKEKLDFFSGNIIPDLTRNKQNTHFYKIGKLSYVPQIDFYVPNINIFTNKFLDFNNMVNLGIYTHLFLDYNYLSNFLCKKFIYKAEEGTMVNPKKT